MKAVRIHEHGGPDVLRWEEIADPECPPDRVILRIKASSINHLDIWVRNGFPGIPLPLIPGSDGSGVVHEVGAEVKDWEPGDEVMIQPGTYCSECRFCRRGRRITVLHSVSWANLRWYRLRVYGYRAEVSRPQTGIALL